MVREHISFVFRSNEYRDIDVEYGSRKTLIITFILGNLSSIP